MNFKRSIWTIPFIFPFKFIPLVNFRIERTQDVDTMYELWILFEIVRHLDSRFIMTYQPIVESKNKFRFFILFTVF